MARVLPIAPAAVPTLDELIADPTRATALPRATIQELLHRCVGAQTILLGALAASEPNNADTEPDRLLDIAAAAERLGMSKDWVYRHAKQLPFRRPGGPAPATERLHQHLEEQPTSAAVTPLRKAL